jgi:glutamate synthase domain-containing protein 1
MWSIHPGLNALVETAKVANLPMLGNVDRYDDTRFNRMQVEVVGEELRQLIDSAEGDVVAAARELLAMVDLVDLKPHRYLIFIGD